MWKAQSRASFDSWAVWWLEFIATTTSSYQSDQSFSPGSVIRGMSCPLFLKTRHEYPPQYQRRLHDGESLAFRRWVKSILNSVTSSLNHVPTLSDSPPSSLLLLLLTQSLFPPLAQSLRHSFKPLEGHTIPKNACFYSHCLAGNCRFGLR